ncbi:MAG: histidine kinase [Syntrophobacterales bacterium]|nr:histidine kinase [Syntrophobacterales bacterium]
MWQRFSLRTRILLLLAALVLTTLAGGLVSFWHNEATEQVFTSLVDRHLAAFQAAEELENALLRQKGYLTYFFIDGEPRWLEELDRYHQAFLRALDKARATAHTPPMADVIHQIQQHYQDYHHSRSGVIELYRQGRKEEGWRRHQEARGQYAAIIDLCERLKLTHDYAISRTLSENRQRVRLINTLTTGALITVVGLGALLLYVLFRQILEPLRQLAQDANPADEVTAVSRRMQTLKEDIDQAQSQLEKSQESLLQAEKLALVGKLAAGVAHSIRNPLTSVKMRLFSLGRHLHLTPTQKEDLEVISQEIRHIDTIVRSFLEFSRPPKLKMQPLSLSEVVDSTLTLLRQRLESYGVRVEVQRGDRLPVTRGDPEQLKEMLVNLLLNACEAMPHGGHIIIREGQGHREDLGPVVTLTVQDSGPGIPASIREKIFQPFFSTKEEGTGLGLSIVQRIVSEHGGLIQVSSPEGQGAAFVITLPLREDAAVLPAAAG